MKNLLTLLTVTFCMFGSAAYAQKSFHDFTVTAIGGTTFPLSSLKGKKVMVVNVASKCGLTPQYEQLQELYDTYQDNNFVIIRFSGKQLPRTGTRYKRRNRSVLQVKLRCNLPSDGENIC